MRSQLLSCHGLTKYLLLSYFQTVSLRVEALQAVDVLWVVDVLQAVDVLWVVDVLQAVDVLWVVEARWVVLALFLVVSLPNLVYCLINTSIRK